MDGSSVLNDDIVLQFKNYLSHLEGMESIAQSSDNHNYRAIIKVRVLESVHRRDSEMCFVSYGATTAGFPFLFSPHFMCRIVSNRSEIVNPSFAPLFLEKCLEKRTRPRFY